MAATGTGHGFTEREKYERLSDLYLTLWKQLDVLSGAAKWLDIRPVGQEELAKRASGILSALAPQLRSGEPSTDVIYKDFRKTQRFVEGSGEPEVDGTRLDVFKDYLRDHALRLSQAVEEH